MLIPPRRVLADVQMKTNRAQVHFDTLQTELDKWLHNPKSCTIREGTDFEKQVHIFQIEIAPLPEIIPGVLGDFVCCLRSSLDQLAWGLAHIWPSRKFTRTEERRIQFPIFEERNATYEDRIKLFPPAVATVIDSLQPYLRGNAFRDDPLWKLNELWTMDKHRAIPMNSNALAVNLDRKS